VQHGHKNAKPQPLILVCAVHAALYVSQTCLEHALPVLLGAATLANTSRGTYKLCTASIAATTVAAVCGEYAAVCAMIQLTVGGCCFGWYCAV
jgi:hypothetical protein